MDVDDVLIAGQHQAFLEHFGYGSGPYTGAHTDLNDVLPRHLRQPHLIDRIRQAEVQAGRLLLSNFAEAHDHAELIGAHAEGEGIKADDSRQHHDHEERERTGQAGAARHHLLELILTSFEQLFEIGLFGRASRRSRAPRTAAIRISWSHRDRPCISRSRSCAIGERILSAHDAFRKNYDILKTYGKEGADIHT